MKQQSIPLLSTVAMEDRKELCRFGFSRCTKKTMLSQFSPHANSPPLAQVVNMGTTEREAGLVAKKNLKRGAWTREEDERLSQCVKFHGETRWRLVPAKAGLNRCPRSCRMRWLNYLTPSIKRGNITEEEVDLIFRLHKLLGNRWALIAGRLPGRTDNEIKNYWKTHLSKKIRLQQPQQRQTLNRPELVEERNGLTPINDAGGCNELRIEPRATAEAGASMNELNIEQIVSVDDGTMDCCFCNSSTVNGATDQSGFMKHKAPSDGDATHGFNCGSLNDYDFCFGMNLDSDMDFQSFIRSLFCEEA